MTEKTLNLVEAKARIDNAEKAVTAITDTEKGIAELNKKYAGVVFEVTTTKGMDEAKAARKEIREPRYTIEHLRKDAKAPVLALGRVVDSIAADLTRQILEIEEPIDKQIKDEEARKAEEKRLAEEAERKRVAAHRDNIDALRLAVDHVCSDNKLEPDDVDKLIAVHESMPVTDAYEEFFDEAQQSWEVCLVKLRLHKQAMVERLAEEKRQAERDAELEQLRREKEEREEADRKEAERKAAVKAELERKAAEKAAAIPPVEEQLGEMPIDLPGVGTVPDPQKPTIDEETAYIETQQPDYVQDYPGTDPIVEAVAKHFDVPLLTAIAWMQRFAEEVLGGEQA